MHACGDFVNHPMVGNRLHNICSQNFNLRMFTSKMFNAKI